MDPEYIVKLLDSVEEPEMAHEVEGMHNRLDGFSNGLDKYAIAAKIQALEELLAASSAREQMYQRAISYGRMLIQSGCERTKLDTFIKMLPQEENTDKYVREFIARQIELLAMEHTCATCAGVLYKRASDVRLDITPI